MIRNVKFSSECETKKCDLFFLSRVTERKRANQEMSCANAGAVKFSVFH